MPVLSGYSVSYPGRDEVALVVQEKGRLAQLTGLRAFAATLVFLSHVDIGVPPVVGRILGQGYVGVSFFFVLSGFVLAYSYADALRSRQIGWREYVALRAARLLPLHILVSLPFAAVLLADGTFDPITYAINAALLQSWVPSSDVYFSFNALSWSLSNEAFFYALLPVLVGLTAAARVRLLTRLLLIVAASATIFTLFLDGRIAFGERPLTNWVFYIFPAFRLVEFVTGLVIFDLWSRGVFSHWRLTPVAIPTLIGAMAFAPHVPDAFRVSLFFLPFAVLLLVSHLSDRPSFLGRLLSSWLMQRLGEASFAFYLVHWMVLLIVQRFAGPVKDIVDSDLLLGLASYALAVLVAVALHLGFEKPVEKRLRAVIHGRFGRAAPRGLASRVA